jgi:hypothetical protein
MPYRIVETTLMKQTAVTAVMIKVVLRWKYVRLWITDYSKVPINVFMYMTDLS